MDDHYEQTKKDIIESISERIKDEHRKHSDIDWEYIAAKKIYDTLEGVFNNGK